jgi:hypothetical protein
MASSSSSSSVNLDVANEWGGEHITQENHPYKDAVAHIAQRFGFRGTCGVQHGFCLPQFVSMRFHDSDHGSELFSLYPSHHLRLIVNLRNRPIPLEAIMLAVDAVAARAGPSFRTRIDARVQDGTQDQALENIQGLLMEFASKKYDIADLDVDAHWGGEGRFSKYAFAKLAKEFGVDELRYRGPYKP